MTKSPKPAKTTTPPKLPNKSKQKNLKLDGLMPPNLQLKKPIPDDVGVFFFFESYLETFTGI
jgi:hypothetical protein